MNIHMVEMPEAKRCSRPRSSNPDLSRSFFTIIELMIVVSMISFLALLLLPVLSQARDKARIVGCLSNLRQMGIAFTHYAADQSEYPTNYENHVNDTSHNWEDECAGRMYGNPPATAWDSTYVPNGTDAFPEYSGTQAGAWHRIAAGEYVPRDRQYPTEINLCTASLPVPRATGHFAPGWQFPHRVWKGSITLGHYYYNGPHTRHDKIENNGSFSGLYLMGRHNNPNRMVWGIRYRQRELQHDYSDVAFMGCPSVYERDQKLIREPHGFFPAVPYDSIGYGNGQQDWSPSRPDILSYNRNYLFGDLHAEYIKAVRRGSFH